VVFNVSSDEYRWRMSEGMRYLVAGLDTLSATTSSLGVAITELADEAGRTNFLLEVVASNQREIIERLNTPLATKAAEVLRRAAWAAEQGFWAEALQDYDKAIALDWHQPAAHFGRGLALLAQAGPNDATERQWGDAIGSFEKAARYGERLDPPLAVPAVQCAVACNDRLVLQPHCVIRVGVSGHDHCRHVIHSVGAERGRRHHGLDGRR
jgi:tetratricopeptide (TPR) repeat protein